MIVDIDTHFEPGRRGSTTTRRSPPGCPTGSRWPSQPFGPRSVISWRWSPPTSGRRWKSSFHRASLPSSVRRRSRDTASRAPRCTRRAMPTSGSRGWTESASMSRTRFVSKAPTTPADCRDRALARETISACNRWLADRVDGYQDRLPPLTTIDATDVDLERGRAHADARARKPGVSHRHAPAPGYPPMHERFEPLWSAAEDLGMVAFVHPATAPASIDPAWANYPDGMVLRQLGASQSSQSAILMLNGMVFGGVFDRHPKLTVVFAELGIHWFAGAPCSTWRTAARPFRSRRVYMGRYPYELTPSEFVRRNVRITPLPRAHQSPVQLLEEFPECVVFSSDYAHMRATRNRPRTTRTILADVQPEVRVIIPRREPRCAATSAWEIRSRSPRRSR